MMPLAIGYWNLANHIVSYQIPFNVQVSKDIMP